MIFLRPGEITGNKKSVAGDLEAQEIGDEYQRGLACGALALLVFIIGVVMLIVYFVYVAAEGKSGRTIIRDAGLFLIGVAVFVAIPTVLWIVLFFNQDSKRKGHLSGTDEHPNTKTLFKLYRGLEYVESLRLLNAVEILARKCSEARINAGNHSKSLDTFVKNYQLLDRRFKSFSEFGKLYCKKTLSYDEFRTMLSEGTWQRAMDSHRETLKLPKPPLYCRSVFETGRTDRYLKVVDDADIELSEYQESEKNYDDIRSALDQYMEDMGVTRSKALLQPSLSYALEPGSSGLIEANEIEQTNQNQENRTTQPGSFRNSISNWFWRPSV